MDLLAELLRTGTLDRSGKWDRESRLFCRYGFENEEGAGILLPGTGLRILQKEIRQLQLAKAAIRAGMDMLMEEVGLKAKRVSEVILSGGFASYLNPESAIRIGLLPEEAGEQLVLAGNTSLQGAKRMAEHADARREAGELASAAELVMLSGNSRFEELFLQHLSF